MQAARPRFPVEREEGARIAKAFFEASATGDIAALRSMPRRCRRRTFRRRRKGYRLSAGRSSASTRSRACSRGLARKSWIQHARKLQDLWIDGLPGYFSLEPGGMLQTVALDIQGGLIVGIYFTRNPDKLQRMAKLFGGSETVPTPH